MLDETVVEMIREQWRSAPRGHKTAVIRKWAEITGLSYSRVYARMRTGRRRSGAAKIAGIERQAEIIAQIKKRPPEHRGEIATEDAMEIARANGFDITASRSAIDRAMRRQDLSARPRRVSRWQADYPNQLHHTDASSSDAFYAARRLDDGDYVLKLYKGYQGYKNKPVPIRERPWVYGLVDDHSGVAAARYVVAPGECWTDALDFLCWCWAADEQHWFCGIPEHIKADHGPLLKSEEATSFLFRLGVALDPSIPGAKEAHGKVERPWRTLWQRFERPFFAEDFKSFEIRLSELNARLMHYLDRYNDKPHRFTRGLTRKQAWMAINQRGGVLALPKDAIAKVVRRHERTIAQDGTFKLDGEIYEVRELHSAKVRVWEGVFDSRVVVENPATGERMTAEKFQPNGFGAFKASARTGDQRARSAAEEIVLENTLYKSASGGPEPPRGVVRFPSRARLKGTADVPDLLSAADSYPDEQAAMADFIRLSGMAPDGEVRESLLDLFRESGLSRAFVREIAADACREAM